MSRRVPGLVVAAAVTLTRVRRWWLVLTRRRRRGPSLAHPAARALAVRAAVRALDEEHDPARRG